MEQFDTIIIGTGQAGPSLAARCAEEGLKTAVIERDQFGGTCVNTGCTPTKALVASARAAYMAHRMSDFGIDIDGSISIDMEKVKARKDAIVKESTEGVERWLKDTENIRVYEGHARFEDENVLSVGRNKLTADKIFINVGGRAFIPSGFDEVNYLTNSSILDLDKVPDHLIIVGGGYIGLEFGQMYRRFGSKITIIEQGRRLLPREDEDISNAIQEILENEGINFRFGAECIGGSNEDGQIVVDVNCKSGPPQVTGSHLLLATGRRPNTDDLGLEHTTVQTDDRGFIQVDNQLRTTGTDIWALGDCNGEGAFTHTAYNDFEIVAANLFDDKERRLSDRIMCYGLYIDPALGRVGMTEARAKESDRKVLIGKRPMDRIARAKEKGETRGFMKILVDADTENILGAAILGIEGDEIIHSIIDIMYAGESYTTIRDAVHIHPTVSELIPTMLENLEPLN
ncbi:FAD-containing oxidoreductase [Fodinibius sediminis]|uniref:Pyruvate/2-oxoglutarate dehydrogenase complex, dihydrolipoamide dehydrogenase (E3) component n=1 Tax=Fodinibius sediminis TaxID=1214077 RepID=A0A521CKI3_9BACT|nr:FAD-containing oxidoreductase [Fodinibius sediminis]SMO59932.1 Pyruvate/2-oxoglutarate dehydrogenase complex, dihydrolipoamide dehydrogenase (E3) component [Fodinibius sediminis]